MSRSSVSRQTFLGRMALIEDFTKWFFVNNGGQTVIDLLPNRVVQTSGDRHMNRRVFRD